MKNTYEHTIFGKSKYYTGFIFTWDCVSSVIQITNLLIRNKYYANQLKFIETNGLYYTYYQTQGLLFTSWLKRLVDTQINNTDFFIKADEEKCQIKIDNKTMYKNPEEHVLGVENQMQKKIREIQERTALENKEAYSGTISSVLLSLLFSKNKQEMQTILIKICKVAQMTIVYGATLYGLNKI